MYEIPKPELLNPDRVDRDDREDFTLDDHRSQSQLLAKALGESCAYADQLWEQLNELRGYLLHSLPPDPHAPGPHSTASASPTGPADDDGWSNWINAFSATTSVLCGSHGDSGFGLSRAREVARLRRSALDLTAHTPDPESGLPEPAASSTPATPRTPDPPGDARGSRAERATTTAVKTAAGAVLAVLVVRGLRPRPRAGRSGA